METTRVIGIRYPDGTHMRIGLTETDFQIFQELMKEGKLEPYQAYKKMKEIRDTKQTTAPPIS